MPVSRRSVWLVNTVCVYAGNAPLVHSVPRATFQRRQGHLSSGKAIIFYLVAESSADQSLVAWNERRKISVAWIAARRVLRVAEDGVHQGADLRARLHLFSRGKNAHRQQRTERFDQFLPR